MQASGFLCSSDATQVVSIEFGESDANAGALGRQLTHAGRLHRGEWRCMTLSVDLCKLSAHCVRTLPPKTSGRRVEGRCGRADGDRDGDYDQRL